MATNYLGNGATVSWTNGTGVAVVSGQVVIMGTLADATIGIAHDDIAIAAVGVVNIEGKFSVPKVSAAVIVQGETVNWDASAAEFDDNQATPATGDVTDGAIALASAGSGVLTVDIKLVPAGVLTA